MKYIKIKERERETERERVDKSIKTQVNRHIHTKHTGKQLNTCRNRHNS